MQSGFQISQNAVFYKRKLSSNPEIWKIGKIREIGISVERLEPCRSLDQAGVEIQICRIFPIFQISRLEDSFLL